MRKFFVCAACACMLLSGCTQSNIVNTHQETIVGEPDFEEKEGIEIDWEQVSDECQDIFLDTNEYEYSKDINFYLEPEQKKIMLIWTVADDFPPEMVMEYAEYLVKGFNDIVAEQDFSIKVSSPESLGGLWEEYGLLFGIAPESTQDDESTWFINAELDNGSETDLSQAQ